MTMIEFSNPQTGRVAVAVEHVVALVESSDATVTILTVAGPFAYPGTYAEAVAAMRPAHRPKAMLPRPSSGPRLTYAKDSLTEWGAGIRTRRVAKGWTGEELAKRMGTTASTVSRWENGLSEPRRGTKVRLAEVFEVDPHELFPQ